MKSILAHIEQEARRRMEASIVEIAEEAFDKADTEVRSFYDGGSPIKYARTGQLGNSVKTENFSIGGDSASVTISVGDGLSYTPAGRSGEQILDAAENGGLNIVGKGGFWQRTRRGIPKIVASALSKHFS